MTKSLLCLSLSLALTTTLALAQDAGSKPQLGSFGIELDNRDSSIKPGDDFDRYANGHWESTYQLKDYESDYGSFDTLADLAEIQQHEIVEDLQKRTDLAPGSKEQKLRDFYASYMDLAARDKAGIAPIQPILDRIAAIDSPAKLTAAFANVDLDNGRAPVLLGVDVDRKNPDQYLVSLRVGGLGLPDKDYYLNPDARFVKIRAAYVAHIQRMLGFTGVNDIDSKARAEAVMALETALAGKLWDRAALREREKTYNPTPFAELATRYPGYDWNAAFTGRGLPLPTTVNVVTPDAVNPVLEIIAKTPLPVWRDYLSLHVVRNNGPLLSQQIDEAVFDFGGKVLRGAKSQREPWKRALALVGDTDGLGDVMGEIYVSRHFKPESKASMDALVENLRKALRQNIQQLDWMGPDTKAQAYRKLETFRPKIGYPSKWRDYSSVSIVANDLMANVRQMRKYYLDDENRRVGQKTDRDEWFMTPQTINAYYNAQFNEIVFPAAILQAPFFDVNADPAVNYGAIGAVIGHEMGHGFDDQGSKSDYAGIQRNWWTDADRARFEARIKNLGAQFDGFCPLPGQCVNGKLTMGENIGDLGGLSMAYTAYHLSLNGKEAPVIDGLTGDQRFFLAWAQVWKSKYRDEALVNLMKSDPHSPAMFRINGPLRNLNEWYQAFGVAEGDKLYLKPEERVRIW